MADEKTETTETTETKTNEVLDNGLPKGFSDTMDKIDKENEEKEEKETSETSVNAEDSAGIKSAEEAEEKAEKTETATAVDKVNLEPEVLERIRRDYGYDDDKIDRIAKLAPEWIDEIRNFIAEEKSAETKPESKADGLKFNLDPDIVGTDLKNAVDTIAAELNEQKKVLNEERTRLERERQVSFRMRIDNTFDKHSKDIPVLGNSADTLNKEQKDVRIEIYEHANVTAHLKRISIEKAIEIEINNFKNRDGEKAAAQRLLNSLDSNKKRLINPPTRRNSDISIRKFATPEEEKRAVMEEMYKKAGIE